MLKCWRGSFICDLVHFPFFIPQVPLTHPDDPLNGEFGKISSLEESHEDAGQNGDGAPGISRHDLFGKTKTCFTAFTGGRNAATRTHHFVLLYVRVPPLEHSKVKLVGLLWRRTAVVKLHHSRLEDPARASDSNHAACSGGGAPVQVNTSWRNSTDTLFFPNVVTRDILTQVLNPPEKVHLEQFLSHSIINLDLF